MAECTQERALEKGSLSVDCGKGTLHSSRFFISHSHSDDFQHAIDHIIDDDLFKLHLPMTYTCRAHAFALKGWLGKPDSKTIVEDFLVQFEKDISEVVTCLTNGKKLYAGREKMWTC